MRAPSKGCASAQLIRTRATQTKDQAYQTTYSSGRPAGPSPRLRAGSLPGKSIERKLAWPLLLSACKAELIHGTHRAALPRRADPLRVSLAYPAAPVTPCTCDSLEETCAAETARKGRTRGRTEGVRGSHTEGLLPSRRRSKTRLQRQLQCTGGTAPSTNSAKPRALCRRRAAAATGAAADCRPFHGR